ncbi:transposase [Streptomyces sp. NBC_01205]|uniref:transposase n=1 Tax=Streptomyces sp. NBC_01205 TaxID=2903771 RepID=UPI002E11854D
MLSRAASLSATSQSTPLPAQRLARRDTRSPSRTPGGQYYRRKASFRELCTKCPLRERCTKAKAGRILTIRPPPRPPN